MASKSATKDGGNYIVSEFYGLNTANNNPKNLKPGEAQDSLNWITGWNPELKAADNLQLRLGSALLTKTRLGAGKINALSVGQDTTGKEWVFFAAGGQFYYFNTSTNDLQIVGNGTLPATEDMTLEFYQDLFGPYMYSGSQNSGINVISVANKQMVSTGAGNVTGYLTIRQNFGWMWNWLNSVTKLVDTNDLNQSQPDQVSVIDASISNPQGSTGVSGNGVLKTFSGTLANFSNLAFTVQIGAPINSSPVTSFTIPAGSPFAASFNISIIYTGPITFSEGDFVVIQGSNFEIQLNDCIGIVESVSANAIAVNFLLLPASLINNTYTPTSATLSKLEMFEDDGNGNLKSTLGDTGTINYVNGAFTINTQVPIPNGLNIDSIAFTGIPGVIDFQPGFWQQFGGQLKAVKFFANQLYEFHEINTWLLTLGYSSQTSASGTQQMYRQNMGAPFFRSAYEKGDGILFLDNTMQNNPHFRELQISDFNNAVEPDDLSADLDLSQNNFSQCLVGSIGNYDFLSCQSINNAIAKGYNDTCYLRNNISGMWDKTDFRVACMDSYNGTILAGDTISQNIFQLFVNVDDDGSPINNQWTGGLMNLNMSGLKRFYYFLIDIYIGISQTFNIYLQFDTGAFVLIGTVNGTDSDVDRNDSVVIGQGLSGNNVIGGAGNGQIFGYRCRRQINWVSDLFEYIAPKFQCTKFGALQVNEFGFMSIRQKPQRVLTI